MALTSQRRRRGLVAIVAAVIAAGAFLLILTTRTETGGGGAAVATQPVVVAGQDLKAGDELKSANVAINQSYPVAGLPPANGSASPVVFSDTTTLLSSSHYVSVDVPKGQVIYNSMVASSATAARAGFFNLKSGSVAMSIPFTTANGAGGYIQAGDHIDMLIDDSVTNTIRYGFQDVNVLKVGSSADQPTGTTTVASTPTLLLIELPREQAASLTYLIDHQAIIRYVLRPRDSKGPLPNSAPVNANNWQSFLDG